jgi:hypothetical protein
LIEGASNVITMRMKLVVPQGYLLAWRLAGVVLALVIGSACSGKKSSSTTPNPTMNATGGSTYGGNAYGGNAYGGAKYGGRR